VAIETALTLRLVFNLPPRQTEGFLRSFLDHDNGCMTPCMGFEEGQGPPTRSDSRSGASELRNAMAPVRVCPNSPLRPPPLDVTPS
jgi:hypothetical protein